MLMATKKHYFVKCLDENRGYNVKTDETTIVCPSNSAHSVETFLLGISAAKEVLSKIKEEDPPVGSVATGGRYRSESLKINADAGPSVTTVTTKIYPYPTSFLSVEYVSKDEHEGDHLIGYAARNTIVGTITRDVAIGDTVIQVDPTAFAYLSVGYNLNLYDGINSNDLGEVKSRNSATNEVTVSSAATTAFSDITPTYCRLNVIMINHEIGPAWHYVIGEEKIGGSYVSANSTLTIEYTNNTGAAKTFIILLKYLY